MGRTVTVQVLVDLSRCQAYGQCVYAAPDIFRLEHEEVLEWQYAVDDSRKEEAEQALHACPVQAITLGRTRPEPA